MNLYKNPTYVPMAYLKSSPFGDFPEAYIYFLFDKGRRTVGPQYEMKKNLDTARK